MLFRVLPIVVVLGAAFTVGTPSAAAPSKELAEILDSPKKIWIPKSSPNLQQAMDAIDQHARKPGKQKRIKIGIAVVRGRPPQPFQLKDSLLGTTREVLDQVAATAGFTWEANGDWINLGQQTKDLDVTVTLDQIVPFGTVTVSRDWRKATRVHDWLMGYYLTHRTPDTHTLQVVRTPEQMKAREEYLSQFPDPVMLKDPTIWEYMNADHDLYGSDSYTVDVELVRSDADDWVRVHHWKMQ